MARITRAALHLPPEEVKERTKNDPNPLYRERWLIIYNALFDPRDAKDYESLDEVIQKPCDGLMERSPDLPPIHSMTYFPHLRMASKSLSE